MNAATDMSLIANTAPPIIELDDTPVGRTTTTSAEVSGPNEGPAPNAPDLDAPKSASEAAERNDRVAPRSAPANSVVTPEAVSPTAPAESVPPR